MDLPSDIPYSERFLDLEYENGYILSFLFSQILITIIGSLYFLLQKLKVMFRKRKSHRKQARRKLRPVYAFYLRMLFEISLELVIISSINILMKQIQTSWEQISFWLAVVLFVVLIRTVVYSY